ncbi:hypothetical protein QR680_005022 [Steinernema hermaphroditum]|uniref:Ubiquitin-like protease family profile domain-containing protein n=1 Tax=Steinernema hermaphroditum TaxID=289476 RepID=A0AA39HQL1_9BILA|nr:hypothetical protein QR680_005022 [Steinernema hermaphroditum]
MAVCLRGKRVVFSGIEKIVKLGWIPSEDNVGEDNYLSSSALILILGTLQKKAAAERFAFVVPDFFSQRKSPMNFVALSEERPRVIFLPRCFANHWTLYVLDVEKWTLAHYDPLRGNADCSVHFNTDFVRVQSAARATFHRKLPLKVIHAPEGLQKDAYNCGIYICLFALSVMTNSRRPVNVDITKARSQFAAMVNQKEEVEGAPRDVVKKEMYKLKIINEELKKSADRRVELLAELKMHMAEARREMFRR